MNNYRNIIFVPNPGLVWRSILSGGVVEAKERGLTVGRVCLRRSRSLAASHWSSGSSSGRPVVVREHFCVFPLLYLSPPPTPPFSELTFFRNLFFFFLCPFIHITFSHDCPSPRPIKFKAVWRVKPPPKEPCLLAVSYFLPASSPTSSSSATKMAGFHYCVSPGWAPGRISHCTLDGSLANKPVDFSDLFPDVKPSIINLGLMQRKCSCS